MFVVKKSLPVSMMVSPPPLELGNDAELDPLVLIEASVYSLNNDINLFRTISNSSESMP